MSQEISRQSDKTERLTGLVNTVINLCNQFNVHKPATTEQIRTAVAVCFSNVCPWYDPAVDDKPFQSMVLLAPEVPGSPDVEKPSYAIDARIITSWLSAYAWRKRRGCVLSGSAERVNVGAQHEPAPQSQRIGAASGEAMTAEEAIRQIYAKLGVTPEQAAQMGDTRQTLRDKIRASREWHLAEKALYENVTQNNTHADV